MIDHEDAIKALFWLKLINTVQLLAQAAVLASVFYAGYVVGGLE